MAKVLIVSPNPTADAGGVERFCNQLGGALESDGHDVLLCGPRRRGGQWMRRVAMTPLVESLSVTKVGTMWKPDLVVTNGYLSGRPSAWDAQRIHVFHGTMVGHAWFGARGQRRRERLRAGVGGGIAETLAGRRATTVAVSEQAAGEVQRIYRTEIDVVIPNGVDTSLFYRRDRSDARLAIGLKPDERFALFVGRAEPRKGPEIAAAAAKMAGFTLLVAGPVAIPEARHLGVLSAKQLALFYSGCDCVVFPTRYEACSYVVLEALAADVPLVTTDTGWMKTLLQNVPQYRPLIRSTEPTDIAEILHGLTRPDISAAVEVAGRWVRMHNSLDKFSTRWLELVNDVLAR